MMRIGRPVPRATKSEWTAGECLRFTQFASSVFDRYIRKHSSSDPHHRLSPFYALRLSSSVVGQNNRTSSMMWSSGHRCRLRAPDDACRLTCLFGHDYDQCWLGYNLIYVNRPPTVLHCYSSSTFPIS